MLYKFIFSFLDNYFLDNLYFDIHCISDTCDDRIICKWKYPCYASDGIDLVLDSCIYFHNGNKKDLIKDGFSVYLNIRKLSYFCHDFNFCLKDYDLEAYIIHCPYEFDDLFGDIIYVV